jgi:phosphoserine aminotransferase
MPLRPIFAIPIDYNKCDVLTWSWQKVLGGEAGHGMLAISPKAVERLQTHQPSWPIPKAFRLTENKKLISGIFKDTTINTPSMLCVEDVLDTLNWVEKIGGLEKLFERSNSSLKYVSDWVNKTPWVEFMNPNEKTRSNTGITFQIKEDWFQKMEESKKRNLMSKITNNLAKENVAYDINGYPKAPPSFRIWGGGTVEPEDINALLPWIDWAYSESKADL